MNKHTKTALFVAPVLIILGYILSDIYLENNAYNDKVVQLLPVGNCDILNKSCVLEADDLQVSIYDENGTTFINSTFQLTKATLFLVDINGQSTEVKLQMHDNPFYWKQETQLRQLTSNSGDKYKLRLIAEIKGGKYISEFYTKTF
ncbi:hypothetical protein [uncultured Psychrosphaera sp.]|uniref:hypothetical protein n=1 Tax=uncultured Psychrosphaera sp. TaxID=1403522 RepID=UPI0026127387|nr:hypothetical protein [uncultured Psychrosphaera sp.]